MTCPRCGGPLLEVNATFDVWKCVKAGCKWEGSGTAAKKAAEDEDAVPPAVPVKKESSMTRESLNPVDGKRKANLGTKRKKHGLPPLETLAELDAWNATMKVPTPKAAPEKKPLFKFKKSGRTDGAERMPEDKTAARTDRDSPPMRTARAIALEELDRMIASLQEARAIMAVLPEPAA